MTTKLFGLGKYRNIAQTDCWNPRIRTWSGNLNIL